MSKKKAVKKMAKKIEKETYEISKEQYDKLYQMINWDNPLNDLESLKGYGESSMMEIGYKVGQLHCIFENFLENCQQILENIAPNPVNENDDEEDDEDEEDDTFDWDDNEEDDEN